MTDIAADAGVSVGTIYGRFTSKDAMIPALYARYDERLGELIDRVLDDAWLALPLSKKVSRLVSGALDHYADERGLLRLIALPGSVRPPAGTMQPNGQRLLRRINDGLAQHASEIAHDDRSRAISFALYHMYSTARDWTLFPDAPQMAPLPRARTQLVPLLTHSMLSFLITPEPPR